MKITSRQLIILFLLAYCLTLLFPALFPFIALRPLIPIFLLTLYSCPQLRSMQLAAIYGLMIDLSIPETPFGSFCLIYTLTMGIIYGQKRTFFEDHPTTIPILSLEISILLSLMEFALMAIIGKPLAISWGWVLLDLLVYSGLDALFSMVWIWYAVPYFIGEEPQVEAHDLPERPQ